MSKIITTVPLAAAALLAAYVLTASQVAPDICVDAETREHTRAVVISGIEQALRAQTQLLYQSWLKDPAQQPQRAKAGMQSALRAYLRSRADAMDWQPPPCG